MFIQQRLFVDDFRLDCHVITNSFGKFKPIAVSDEYDDVSYRVQSSSTYVSDTKLHCIFLQETYSIEDCIFYDPTENSASRTSSTVKNKIYNSLSITDLPNHFVWEMDMKISVSGTSGDRIFFTPQNLSGDQPSNALWIQYESTFMNAGSRRSGSTYSMTTNTPTASADTYATFKMEREGSTITGSVDDTVCGTLTETWIDNYSSWWFSYVLWRPNATLTWKNIKVKAL